MRRHLGFTLILAGLAWLGTSTIRAQVPVDGRRPEAPGPHTLLPGGISPEDAEKRLAERLRRNRDTGRLQKLLEDVMKDPDKFKLRPEDLEGLNPGKMDFDPNDPKWKDFIDKIRDKIPPEDLEAARRLLENKRPPIPDVPRPVDPPKPGDPPRPIDPPPMPGDPPPMPPRPPFDGRNPPVPPPVDRDQPGDRPRRARDSWIGKQIEKLRRSTGEMAVGLRRAFDRVTSRIRLGEWTRGLANRTRDLGRRLLPRLDGLKIGNWFRDFRLFNRNPRFGGFAGPGPFAPRGGGGGTGFAVGGPGLGGGMGAGVVKFLLFVVFFIVGGVVLYLLWQMI